MRRLLALSLALTGLSLCARPAHAYLLPSGDEVWAFEGHTDSSLDAGPHTVSGTLQFSSGAGGTAILDLTLDGVPDAIKGFTQVSSLHVQDGAPGTPDGVSVSTIDSVVYAPSILQPYSLNWGNGLWSLQLTDTSGTAFTGLNGQLPPIDPPDASVFETRSIQILQQHCDDFGTGFCSFDSSPPVLLYGITIDRFTAPEAGSASMCALALAALGIARRKLRTA